MIRLRDETLCEEDLLRPSCNSIGLCLVSFSQRETRRSFYLVFQVQYRIVQLLMKILFISKNALIATNCSVKASIFPVQIVLNCY